MVKSVSGAARRGERRCPGSTGRRALGAGTVGPPRRARHHGLSDEGAQASRREITVAEDCSAKAAAHLARRELRDVDVLLAGASRRRAVTSRSLSPRLPFTEALTLSAGRVGRGYGAVDQAPIGHRRSSPPRPAGETDQSRTHRRRVNSKGSAARREVRHADAAGAIVIPATAAPIERAILLCALLPSQKRRTGLFADATVRPPDPASQPA
jgi:hypothetical protein